MKDYPEFYHTGKTLVSPHSIQHAMLTEEIDAAAITPQNQNHHFLFYHRFPCETVLPEKWIFKTREDFAYQIEKIWSFYPLAVQSGNESPPIYLQLWDLSLHKTLFPDPIPLQIITTPAQQQDVYVSVAQNYLIPPNGIFQVEISGQNGTNPAYLDLVIQGLRIPKNWIEL